MLFLLFFGTMQHVHKVVVCKKVLFVACGLFLKLCVVFLAILFLKSYASNLFNQNGSFDFIREQVD